MNPQDVMGAAAIVVAAAAVIGLFRLCACALLVLDASADLAAHQRGERVFLLDFHAKNAVAAGRHFRAGIALLAFAIVTAGFMAAQDVANANNCADAAVTARV